MTWPKPKQVQDQRRKRCQKHAHAFLLTVEGHLLGDVERVPWEAAMAHSGGHVADAAMACGLAAMPKGTKTLWGRSAAAAWATYRRGQQQRQRP